MKNMIITVALIVLFSVLNSFQLETYMHILRTFLR